MTGEAIAHYRIEQEVGRRGMGVDLAQRIARGPIPIDEAVSIASQLADPDGIRVIVNGLQVLQD